MGGSAQSDLRKAKTRKLLKAHQPLSIVAEDKTITLSDYNYEDLGAHYIIENNQNSSDEAEYSIVKREGELSGYIYYPEQPFGYIISTVDGVVKYEKTPSNEIMYTCSFTSEEEAFNQQSVAQEPVYPDTYFVGNYATETDVLKLQSKPGAKYLIYLDFDGEPTLKGWENQGFVATAVTNIPNGLKQRIWESVVADFMPFDVNVTMDRAVFDAHQTVYKGWAVCADFGSPGWYGVAFRPSFGTGKPALIDLPTSWNSNYNYLFRTPSHELGHSLSLSHDGNNLNGDGEYYKGHGEYTPIMGSGNRLVTHWNKGDYSGATNTEDDLYEISRYLGTATDDYAGIRDVVFSGEDIKSIDNHGVIENNTDEDVWKFEMTGTGDVNITVDPVLALSDLDVHLTLKNEAGQTIVEDSPVGLRTASIDQSLDLGTYYLHISSGSELTPSTGWSSYGVFGYYDIYGTVENVVREQHDVIALSLTGLGEVCSTTETLVPEVKIQNGGLITITDLSFKVYEDDVLIYTLQETVNMQSDDIQSFQMSVIVSEGEHTYKVVVVDNNGLETKTENNTVSGSYSYVNGMSYEFFTDIPFYDGNSGITWEIESATNSNSLPESGGLSTNTIGQYTAQEFCLATNNCYEMKFSGEVDNCTGSGRWDANSIYTSGDQCSYAGFNWKALWWTQGEAPPAGVWEKLSPCSAGDYSYGLRDKETAEEQFLNSTTDYTNPTNEDFCIGSITSVKSNIESSIGMHVFPNPVGALLKVNVTGSGTLKVYNLVGEVLIAKAITVETTLDFSVYKSGMYLVAYESENGTVLRRVLK